MSIGWKGWESNKEIDYVRADRDGWVDVTMARKRHYFVCGDHTCLCGQWHLLRYNELEQGNDDSPDNCKVCQKKLKARRTKLKKGGKV